MKQKTKEQKELEQIGDYLKESLFEIKSGELPVKVAREISRMGNVICQTYYLRKVYGKGKDE